MLSFIELVNAIDKLEIFRLSGDSLKEHVETQGYVPAEVHGSEIHFVFQGRTLSMEHWYDGPDTEETLIALVVDAYRPPAGRYPARIQVMSTLWSDGKGTAFGGFVDCFEVEHS